MIDDEVFESGETQKTWEIRVGRFTKYSVDLYNYLAKGVHNFNHYRDFGHNNPPPVQEG